MLSYKFRLYPNKSVEEKLEESLEIARWLYNRLLEEISKARKEGRKITQKDTQALIVKLKKEEKPALKKSLLQSIANGQLPVMLCYVMEQCESIVEAEEERQENRQAKV